MITIHALIVAMTSAEQSEKVERAARRVAFGVVALVLLFVTLWVVIGNLKFRNYETPTPVHISRFCHPPRLTADTVWQGLVLD
jgi:NADH:ubiquinone oxidoreductase subunit 6 (subunit J)